MVTKYEQIRFLSEALFRRLTGVHKATFEHMKAVLSEQIAKNKKVLGRPSRLSEADQVLMMLEYNREYRTYFHIAQSYQVSEATAFRLITRAENLLLQSGEFSLPGKKALLQSSISYQVVLVDATETRIERPPKKQRRYYSAKKKQHHLKTQMIVDKKSGKIICTHFAKGAVHDFQLFKCSQLKLPTPILLLADSGYQGIKKLIPQAHTPKKASKHYPLTRQDQQQNRALSSQRIKIENVFGFLKRFKIFATKYRNRRKRFGLRFNLFAAIANYDTI
ncbi:IS5 family transposase [Adhaeribacter pallidiroseus]|nr:IS5 family transposase [Adhaeribacter pallidiroseus]